MHTVDDSSSSKADVVCIQSAIEPVSLEAADTRVNAWLVMEMRLDIFEMRGHEALTALKPDAKS